MTEATLSTNSPENDRYLCRYCEGMTKEDPNCDVCNSKIDDICSSCVQDCLLGELLCNICHNEEIREIEELKNEKLAEDNKKMIDDIAKYKEEIAKLKIEKDLLFGIIKAIKSELAKEKIITDET